MSIDDRLNEKILEILDTDLERREDFFEKVNDIIKEIKNEGEVYRRLISFLTHLDFSPEEATMHWLKIVDIRTKMAQKIGRPVAFRVALLEYFLEDLRIYKAPLVVEMYIYETVKYNAMVDELTGLYNHRFLREFLWKESKRATRYNKQFSVVILDMDNFKAINESYGHLAGDDFLRNVGKIIEHNIRIEDIAVRYGGDEFLMVLPETNKEGATVFTKRVCSIVETIVMNTMEMSIKPSISAGIATFLEDSVDPVELLELADKALYRAKYCGKNCVVAYQKEEFVVKA